MKKDISFLKEVLKSELAGGIDPDELYVILEQVEDEYNEAKKKAEADKKAKEEQAKKVREELKARAAADVYNAYVKYFESIYPTNRLPKDAKELFAAELKFIDFMMTGQHESGNSVNDLFGQLLKDLAGC